MNNYEVIEIYPKICVYRNILRDPEGLYKVMKRSESASGGKYFLSAWTKWSHFGRYAQAKHFDQQPDIASDPIFQEEKLFVDDVTNAYNIAIEDYVKRYNVALPNGSRFSGNSFCKYFKEVDNLGNDLTMQYHTDFIISQKDMPGDKFFITCTMYINDDYDGGDLAFYINGEAINHKPKAGDIVIFPSGEPYYHGVKTIKNGEKFFVRNFMIYPFEGTEEWLSNQRSHGAYRWAKIEDERIDREDKLNMVYIKDDKKIDSEEFFSQRNENDGGM